MKAQKIKLLKMISGIKGGGRGEIFIFELIEARERERERT